MLVGCQRRNTWINEEMSWPMVSGNAWLDLVGHRRVVRTPLDFMTVWIRDNHIIDFRGGPIREWWREDLYDVWALTTVYSGYDIDNDGLILNEYKGKMIVIRNGLVFSKAKERAAKLVTGYAEGPARLAKDQPRAYHVCRTCPTKRQCDIIDRTTPGGNDDWGPGYPFP